MGVNTPLLPRKEFDRKKHKYAMSKGECERIGCEPTSVFYPLTCKQTGAKLLVCTLCRMADDEWTKLARDKKSKIRERSDRVDFSALSPQNGPNGEAA